MSARLACLALLCCAVAPGLAQQPDLPVPAERKKALLEGTHVFRRILFDYGCTPLESFDDLREEPQRKILVILGDLGRLKDVPQGVVKFVRDGGAVLLASDRPVRDDVARRALAAISGVSINSETVFYFGAGNCYHGIQFCPVLQLTWQQPPLLMENGQPLVVATNVPSHLRQNRLSPAGIRHLAYLSGGASYDLGKGSSVKTEPPDAPLLFLVGGDVGKGRVLVAADHSIFINEMMLPTDTNNVEFTYNCVRYLQGDGQRDQVLMLDEKGIQTKFEIPLKSANPSFEELIELAFQNRNRLLQAGERGLAQAQRNGLFRKLSSRISDAMGDRTFAGVALCGTLALALYGVYRLGIRSRFAHDMRTPTLAGAVAAGQPYMPLIDQRTAALLHAGRLNEPASRMAQRWLTAQGMPPPDESSPDEPPVRVSGGWWAGGRLRNRLRRVWRAAAGKARERFGAAGLWGLQRELEALAAARRRGEWGPGGQQRGGAA